MVKIYNIIKTLMGGRTASAAKNYAFIVKKVIYLVCKTCSGLLDGIEVLSIESLYCSIKIFLYK